MIFMRASWIAIAVLCVSATGFVFGADKPNIILVMADDQGWGDAGYQGHAHLKTPGLDAMAKDGIRFNRFYAGAPVCSPTRGSVLTGRHPYRYGVFFANTGHLMSRELTIAELLKPAGYATGHFGKWHLGTLTTEITESNRGGPKNKAHYSPPWTNGFDDNFSTEAKTPTYDPYLRPKSATGKKWWDPVAEGAESIPYGTNYWIRGKRVDQPLRGDDSSLIMDHALTFIRKQAGARKPFLSVIWFHAPHLPVVASEADRKPYASHDRYTQHYLGSIVALDRQVVRLRAELSALKIDRNTMICYCSDNGPEGNASAPGSAKSLRGRKRSLYEGGIRVPGLVVWPGRIRPGTVSKMPASTLDYLPTILAALKIKFPDKRPIDGISLLPVFADTKTERQHGIGFQSGQQVAWIEDRYKIYGTSKRGKQNSGKPSSQAELNYELYDLRADPKESRDLAKVLPEVLAEKVAKLKAWQASCSKSATAGP